MCSAHTHTGTHMRRDNASELWLPEGQPLAKSGGLIYGGGAEVVDVAVMGTWRSLRCLGSPAGAAFKFVSHDCKCETVRSPAMAILKGLITPCACNPSLMLSPL